MKEKKSNEDNQSFYQKMKMDKRYAAKVKLLGYGIVIVLIIVYLNISNIGGNYNYDKIDTSSEDLEEEVVKEVNLLEKLNDNYTYNIDVSMKKISKDMTGKDLENEIKYNYNGKSYEKNLVINKVFNSDNKWYYKIGNVYYEKVGEQYNEIKKEIIYDILDEDFIEVSGVKEYIRVSNLDHYTNYSSGKREYLYNLKVSDVISNYKDNKMVTINITIEDEVVSMVVDYTNLLRVSDDNVIECIVKYIYKDIDKVEEFVLIDDKNEKENSSNVE